MKENFRTLISGVLAKVSSLYAKKTEVYAKIDNLTAADVDAAPVDHDHSYVQFRYDKASLPPSTDWYCLTYGNGRFVAMCNGSLKAAYSDDGFAWTEVTLPSSLEGCCYVTYGNGKFVTVCGFSDIAAYSEDGIIWTETALPLSDSWTSVTYGNGKFVAICAYSSNVAYSEDGITWSKTVLPQGTNWRNVAYGGGKFVAVRGASNTAAYSEDGITWAETTMPILSAWDCVTYGDGKFVALGGSHYVAYSENGINWTLAQEPEDVNLMAVAYGDGKFVITSDHSQNAAYSEDGITWTTTALPYAAWYSVTYGNGKFVAISYNGQVVYSKDGINWTDEYCSLVQDGVTIDPEELGLATEDYVDCRFEEIPDLPEGGAGYTEPVKVLTWDGDTSGGIETVPGEKLVKIYDKNLDLNKVANLTLISDISPNFGEYVINHDYYTVIEEEGIQMLVASEKATEENLVLGIASIGKNAPEDYAILSEGVYILAVESLVRISKITFTETIAEIIHSIDPKYLPDTVATKADIFGAMEASY